MHGLLYENGFVFIKRLRRLCVEFFQLLKVMHYPSLQLLVPTFQFELADEEDLDDVRLHALGCDFTLRDSQASCLM